jgi:hypothetical protein
VDLAVCGSKCAREQCVGLAEVTLENLSDGFQRQLAGRLAAGVSAHAIGDDEQSVAFQVLEFSADILIDGPDTAHVTLGCDLDSSRADRTHWGWLRG